MEGRCGIATNANPLSFTGTIQAQEMSICYVVVIISAVSAGINGGNPAVITMQTSFDDGATYDSIVGVTIESITAAGKYFAYFTSGVVKIGPQIKVTVTPPAGDTVTISEVRKARVTNPAVFRAPVSGGGGAGEDTVAVLGNAQMTSNGNYTAAVGMVYMMGFDGAVHRQLAVDASGNLVISVGSNTAATVYRHVYSTTNVTTAAWVQIIAATPSDIKEFEVYDSSGQTMLLATGAPGAEVIIAQIPPGGMAGVANFTIAAGTRISTKAVSGTANSGTLVFNGRG